MAYVANVSVAPSNVFGAVAKFFASLEQKIAAYRLYKVTVNELRALSSRELADLGISESDIPYLAQQAAYGRK